MKPKDSTEVDAELEQALQYLISKGFTTEDYAAALLEDVQEHCQHESGPRSSTCLGCGKDLHD